MCAFTDTPPPGREDPADRIARIAMAKRVALLRSHRHRLDAGELEDCLSQAVLELVAYVRKGHRFSDEEHIARVLALRLRARVVDRQRALARASGHESRSHLELWDHEELAGPKPFELADSRQALARVLEVAAELSDDQRRVLWHEVWLDMDAREFCRRFGWSAQKYWKTGQRARARLRALVDEYERGERCLRLAADVSALRAGNVGGDGRRRALAHLRNCRPCAASRAQQGGRA